MYKVLLVDDEPLSIEGLKLIIDWESLDYKICGECGSGEQALYLIKEQSVDLVVTDIRMPGMDGLELIRRVKNDMGEDVQFLIISGYGEFEYAREALQYGVKHYILKPFCEEEIYRTLKDLHCQLEHSKETMEIDNEEKKLISSNIIKSLIEGEDVNNEIYRLHTLIGTGSGSNGWYYIIIGSAYEKDFFSDSVNAKSSWDERQNEIRDMRKVLENSIGIYKNAFIIDSITSCYGLVISPGSFQNQFIGIKDFVKSINKQLLDRQYKNFHIAVGNKADDLSRIKESYITAIQAWNYRFFSQTGNVTFYTDIINNEVYNSFDGINYVDAVIEAMEELATDKCKMAVEKAFFYFRSAFLSPEIVKMYVMNIVWRSINAIKDMAGNPEEFFKQNTGYDLVAKELTIDMTEKILEEYCIGCCSYLKILKDRDYNSNIYKIVEYIKTNFKRSLTIKELSEKFYLHPAYLGQLFVKNFAVGFNEYIHIMRINEAKRLLDETEMKIREIAFELGYVNYGSFLAHFIKYVGQKPTDYKDRAR